MLGDKIKQARIKLNWTQAQLAEKIGVSDRIVTTWENGRFTSIKNENLDTF